MSRNNPLSLRRQFRPQSWSALSHPASDNIPSGAALRRMAIPTVNRIRSMRASLTDGIRFTIAGQADLIAASGGERYVVDPDKISLRWPPELSAGLGDEAEAITMLVQAGLLERETAIQMISDVVARTQVVLVIGCSTSDLDT